jgi:DNA (cytosine-5)-methyltransferase 1
MENVRGMILGKMKGIFNEIMKQLKNADYNVKCKLMNAKYYNVPQSRQRLIFIGVKNDLKINPSYPIPNKNIITAKKAIENVISKTFCDHSLKAQELWKKIKIGKSGFDNKFWDYAKFHPNKPAPTIRKDLGYYGGPGLYHWTENRSFSIEEIKAFCSYPQNYKLIGKYSEQFARLGNSVMPNMMKAIAENIKINILDKYSACLPRA